MKRITRLQPIQSTSHGGGGGGGGGGGQDIVTPSEVGQNLGHTSAEPSSSQSQLYPPWGTFVASS